MRSLWMAAGVLAVLASPAAAMDVGEKAPPFSGKDWFNTKPLSLEKVHGKAVLLELWATW
jgi:hypothetical protein